MRMSSTTFPSFLWSQADHRYRRLPVSSTTPTAVVFFQITSLELPPSANTATRVLGGTAEEMLADQLEAGELGMCVDPKVTKDRKSVV